MADTPRQVTVHLDFSGADEDFARVIRRLVQTRPPTRDRRSLWQRWVGRLHRRSA